MTLVQFEISSAARIGNTVRYVEQLARRGRPFLFDPMLEQAAKKGIRLCKTSVPFNKNTQATLQVWEDGEPLSESATTGKTIAGVVNKYADIAASKFVSVARHGNGHWYVISAEC